MNAEEYYNRGLSKEKLAIEDYNKAKELEVQIYKYEFDDEEEDWYIEEKEVYYHDIGWFNAISDIQDYTKEIELNPDNIEAYRKRGDAKYELGGYKEAVKDYNKAKQNVFL